MNLDAFIARRQESWQRLGTIVNRLTRTSTKRVSADQIKEMIHLYQQVSTDLALLRTGGADTELVRRINRLVIRTHAQLYRGSTQRATSLFRYLIVQYPRLFRQCGWYVIASLALCVSVYAMAYQTVQTHPMVVADIIGGGGVDQEIAGEKLPEDITERFRIAQRLLTSQGMSGIITVNNIKVALTAFALGMTLGIGTVYVLIMNSAMVGGFAGAFAASGIEDVLWITLLPHGALELSAIVVSGAAGLMMGWSMWCPGQRTRRRALRESAVRAVQLVLGLIPAFVVAGCIEGFITPIDAIPPKLKVTIGVLAAAVFWLHLLLGGRPRAAAAA